MHRFSTGHDIVLVPSKNYNAPAVQSLFEESGMKFLAPAQNEAIMAACNFSIPFSGLPTGILNHAQAAIQDQGGEFRGDDMSGTFRIRVLGSDIRGSYNISGQELNVVIDSKPFLIPCGTIENYLKKYLEGVSV